MGEVTVEIALDRCVRCGACATVAPAVFAVGRKGATVRAAGDARAAALICPMQAIRLPLEHASHVWPKSEVRSPKSAIADLVGDTLHVPLFDQAEAVRWQMADIPWDRLDRAKVTPGLVELVRAIAFSEATTFSATRRFLADFTDDADLTQWIAVWFYEESKHPSVLLRWLHHAAGVAVDDQFLHKGRATAPFMKSRMGTLVTNVISEMVASGAYAFMRDRIDEPVLAHIAKLLAADEARHAASFYRYAARHLANSPDPATERRDAVKILYLWFAGPGNELVIHPVNEFFARISTGFDVGSLRDRIFRLIGTLVGVPLDGTSDLTAYLGGTSHGAT